jgi:hypothetical protein
MLCVGVTMSHTGLNHLNIFKTHHNAKFQGHLFNGASTTQTFKFHITAMMTGVKCDQNVNIFINMILYRI